MDQAQQDLHDQAALQQPQVRIEETVTLQVQKDGSALQSGFVWDEAPGYYCGAASRFCYDGDTGLYYDGNNGTWYSNDHSTRPYVPCTDQKDTKTWKTIRVFQGIRQF